MLFEPLRKGRLDHLSYEVKGHFPRGRYLLFFIVCKNPFTTSLS